jgi:4-amino-4-deoxy-L-arabinose transferase-like glycosyltransferase
MQPGSEPSTAEIPSIHRVPFWAFGVGLFFLALLLRLACFTGLVASDDVHYSGYAQLIADARYTPEYHHRAIRYGLLFPLALLYRVFGVSEWTTIAVPLIASSVSVVLLALIGKKLFGVRGALIAALLLATFPLQLRYATVLVPEPILACYLLLAVLLYVRTDDRTPLARSVLTGVVLGVAYLTKEPAAFVALALLVDGGLARRWRQTVGIALGIGAIVALEHAYYVGATGDLLFRYHALAAHNNGALVGLSAGSPVAAAKPVDDVVDHAPSAVGNTPVAGAEPPVVAAPVEDDIEAGDDGFLRRGGPFRRAFINYPQKMIEPNEDFGIHSLAALILAAAAFLRFRHDHRTRLLLLWAAVPWLYSNFGTTSFSTYLPIPPAVRYIDPSYPPLFLFGGWLFADWLSHVGWAKRLFLATIVTVSLIGVATGLSTRATEYRTADVAVLRVIADNAAEKGLDRACVEIDREIRSRWFWQRALFILSEGDLQECDRGPTDLFLRADQVGAPYVASRQNSR